MATIAAQELTIPGLQKSHSNALRKKAEGLGMTPEAYVRDLITMDLALDRAA